MIYYLLSIPYWALLLLLIPSWALVVYGCDEEVPSGKDAIDVTVGDHDGEAAKPVRQRSINTTQEGINSYSTQEGTIHRPI